MYAAEIWGYRYYEQTEHVNLVFACKKFLHFQNKTPNDVCEELGHCPLLTTATVRFIKYWLKLVR